MTLPLHLFGGWLWLFYVGIWIGIIAGLFNCYTILNVQGLVMPGVLVFLILLVNQVIVLILLFNILRKVKIKEQNIPEKIVRLLTWIFVTSFGFSVVAIILSYLFFESASSEFIMALVTNIVRILIYWAIWSNYFMKSKRVSSYYGRGSSRLFKF